MVSSLSQLLRFLKTGDKFWKNFYIKVKGVLEFFFGKTLNCVLSKFSTGP